MIDPDGNSFDSAFKFDLEGADAEFFNLTSSGALTVASPNDTRNVADYEEKSSYSITVRDFKWRHRHHC